MLTIAVLVPVLNGSAWFVKAAITLALVAAAGAVARWAGLPPLLVPMVQVLVVLLYLTVTHISEQARLGWLPGRGTPTEFWSLTATAFDELGAVAAPFTPSPAVTLLVTVGAAVMAIGVDLLLVGLRRAALAGLPLLATYIVPAAVLDDGLPGWLFLLPALGFLLLLVLDGEERPARWGAGVTGRREQSRRRAPGPATRVSGRVGVTVLSLSVALPAAAPWLSDGAFGAGGIGTDPGGGTITTLDPLVSLRRDLVRPADIDLIKIRSDSAQPDELYLRAVTLDSFDGERWSPSRRDVRTFDAALPDPAGLGASVPRTPVRTVVEILGTLQSDYVPMPFPATRLEIDGAWRLDPVTGNVVSRQGEEQISGRTYSVDSLDLAPSADNVSDEPPPAAMARYLSLPPALPTRVADTAERIAADADTALERGIALQRWFRDPANFTYDLSVDPDTGTSAILDFLDDRRGYCQQFAATMAVMARSLGIPSRVSVGFTAGELSDDGLTRIISARDAHAWPELFLGGVGWVRFEPTPGSASSGPTTPGWLADRPSEPPERDEPSRGDPAPVDGSAAESAEESPGSTGTDTPGRCTDPGAPCADRSAGGGEPVAAADEPADDAWRAGQTATLTAVALLLATPALARLTVRRRRWAALARPAEGVAEHAWRELRDSAVDLGYPWPRQRTPRQVAAALAAPSNVDTRGETALGVITTAVERSRYAPGSPPPADVAELRHATRVARRTLAAGATRRSRLRAAVLPFSLFRLVADVLVGRAETPAARRLLRRRLRGAFVQPR